MPPDEFSATPPLRFAQPLVLVWVLEEVEVGAVDVVVEPEVVVVPPVPPPPAGLVRLTLGVEVGTVAGATVVEVVVEVDVELYVEVDVELDGLGVMLVGAGGMVVVDGRAW
jgi:hypothetical protein